MKQHNGASERVRIKGHAASVIRFFFIAVAFMELWILITSQLSYYSKLYGAQILLQLNIAFYAPSIPVLILSGHLEKLLDDHFGNTMSMLLRLNVGLGGCFIICAAFPFLPTTHTALITVIAILGTLSAVAFSTTYQLVQWFRSADTIGLGIGCVGSGPLVLFFQICLGMGSSPERWQLVAIYEIAALLVLVGLCSSLSLFHQYWHILSGSDDDIKIPLVEADAEALIEEPKPRLQRLMTAPDPFMPGPLSPSPVAPVMNFDAEWDFAVPVLQKTTSPSIGRSRSSRVRGLLSRDGAGSRSLCRFGSGPIPSLLEPNHQSYAAEQMLFAPAEMVADAELHEELMHGGLPGGASLNGSYSALPAFFLFGSNSNGNAATASNSLSASSGAGVGVGVGVGVSASSGTSLTPPRLVSPRPGASPLSGSVFTSPQSSTAVGAGHVSHDASLASASLASASLPGAAVHVTAHAGGVLSHRHVHYHHRHDNDTSHTNCTVNGNNTNSGHTSNSGHNNSNNGHTSNGNNGHGCGANASDRAGGERGEKGEGKRRGSGANPSSLALNGGASASQSTPSPSSPHLPAAPAPHHHSPWKPPASLFATFNPDAALDAPGAAAMSSAAFHLPTASDDEDDDDGGEKRRKGSEPGGGSEEGRKGERKKSEARSEMMMGLSDRGSEETRKSGVGRRQLTISLHEEARLAADDNNKSAADAVVVSVSSPPFHGRCVFRPAASPSSKGGVGSNGESAGAGAGATRGDTDGGGGDADGACFSCLVEKAGGEGGDVYCGACDGHNDNNNEKEEEEEEEEDVNFKAEVLLVLQYAWPVVFGFVVSVTVMYLIFPFFTYVPIAHPLGANLPQVLFYSRLFLDIVGRFAPRRKIFMLRSPRSVMALAAGKLALAALFFIYIRSAPQYHNDLVALGLVAALWFLGGYLNTSCNILAPNMVPPALAARASAVMALAFQIAHFLGLVLAALVATMLYGDVVGR